MLMMPLESILEESKNSGPKIGSVCYVQSSRSSRIHSYYSVYYEKIAFFKYRKKIDMLFLFNVEFFKISQNIC